MIKMIDIPSWLQVGLAAGSLGTTALACVSAGKSAKAATQSDQTALWLEKERRHDELHPTRNGLRIGFTHYGGNTSMLIRIDRRYKVSYDVFPRLSGNCYSEKFDYLSEDGEYRKILFRGYAEIARVVIRFMPLTFECDCSRSKDENKNVCHWTYSPTIDELKIVEWKPLD